jgi:hypothetical protein
LISFCPCQPERGEEGWDDGAGCNNTADVATKGGGEGPFLASSDTVINIVRPGETRSHWLIIISDKPLILLLAGIGAKPEIIEIFKHRTYSEFFIGL